MTTVALRLIVVLGTCSGGTSCVAGILHHLGVNMGRVSLDPSKARGYAQYEDADLNRFKQLRNQGPRPGGGWTVNQYLFDWQGYQRHREQSRDDRPIGVKCSGGDVLTYRHHPYVREGVRVVRVTRSLDTVVAKETDRWARLHLGRLKGEELDYAITERAGYAAKTWMATELVCREIPPVATVLYESALQTTEAVVRDLAKKLGMKPSAEQVAAAVGSVRPAKAA
jgi:hypothetical protein